MSACNPLDSMTDIQGDGSGATTIAQGTAPGDGSATGGAIVSSTVSAAGNVSAPGLWAVLKCDVEVPEVVYVVMDGLQNVTGATTRAYSPAYAYNAQVLKSSDIKRMCLVVRDSWNTTCQASSDGLFVESNIWRFVIDRHLVNHPGAYIGCFVAYSHDDRPMWVRHCYVEVRDNSLTKCHSLGLSIASVRLHMRDQVPAANTLLDDLEFSDVEILETIRSAVEYFNEVAPWTTPYSPAHFPWRYHLLQGVMGKLMSMAGRSKLRNFIDTNAAGINTNIERRWADYTTVGQNLWQEYTTWVNRKKIQIDCGNAFGDMPGRALGW